jgi:hypothetical protein
MRFPLIIAFASFGFASIAAAERTCRIVFPERPKDAPKFAFLFDGKMSRRVTLPSMNFSEVISLPPGELTFLMTSTKITDPENLPPGAPKLEIAEADGDFYILVRPDPLNAGLQLRMTKVDTGAGNLKPGETLWLNLTDHRISANLGDDEMSIEPNGRKVSPSPVKKSGYFRAEFKYQPKGQGDFEKITEQQWWYDTKSRHVGFMVDTGGRLPGIFFYRDFR